jgi:DNA invertase Pin-like site-specific DNA recombinase
VRCAIYTRKSTEEGLSQEFNSLDAQRECAEAYIQSQRPQGWIALPEHYDDGGFTGANLERPALKRLLADIEAHRIDCVVIYKVDRLSRSLFDFARLMQIFGKHAVSFVSVTQQLNSNTPMGRLTLHVLLSFAQFEHELGSERTRDKISAARRKGKWTGGYPVLGYDVSQGRLVVNETEAEQVRQIFDAFCRHRLLAPTLKEMQERGWGMKVWTTNKGQDHGPQPFDRQALVRLLRNVIYTGRVSLHGKLYAGEHDPIVDRQNWDRVQTLLRNHPRGSASRQRNRQQALLQDLLICGMCGGRMVSTYTRRRGRRYQYYVCLQRKKKGVRNCPGQSVSAARIEEAVLAVFREAPEASGSNWEGSAPSQQKGILVKYIERISYHGRRREGVLHWRRETSAGKEPAQVSIHIEKQNWTEHVPPARVEQPRVEAVPVKLSRITRLMALAVRLEGLLREGAVKDYAELARLGCVSRARITQILNLRNLAPTIQEKILLPSDGAEMPAQLREPPTPCHGACGLEGTDPTI